MNYMANAPIDRRLENCLKFSLATAISFYSKLFVIYLFRNLSAEFKCCHSYMAEISNNINHFCVSLWSIKHFSVIGLAYLISVLIIQFVFLCRIKPDI